MTTAELLEKKARKEEKTAAAGRMIKKGFHINDVVEIAGLSKFENFLDFFFPNIYIDIDFKKGYSFLNKEFQSIVKDNEIGKRYADELVKVFLKDGSEKCC